MDVEVRSGVRQPSHPKRPPYRGSALDELDGVAEWVLDVATADPWQVVVRSDGDSRRLQLRTERVETHDRQTRVGFSHGAKLCIDAQVELHGPADEPAPTPLRQWRRLWNSLEGEEAAIKGLCVGLTPWRHRQLHVVDSDDLKLQTDSLDRGDRKGGPTQATIASPPQDAPGTPPSG